MLQFGTDRVQTRISGIRSGVVYCDLQVICSSMYELVYALYVSCIHLVYTIYAWYVYGVTWYITSIYIHIHGTYNISQSTYWF